MENIVFFCLLTITSIYCTLLTTLSLSLSLPLSRLQVTSFAYEIAKAL